MVKVNGEFVDFKGTYGFFILCVNKIDVEEITIYLYFEEVIFQLILKKIVMLKKDVFIT